MWNVCRLITTVIYSSITFYHWLIDSLVWISRFRSRSNSSRCFHLQGSFPSLRRNWAWRWTKIWRGWLYCRAQAIWFLVAVFCTNKETKESKYNQTMKTFRTECGQAWYGTWSLLSQTRRDWCVQGTDGKTLWVMCIWKPHGSVQPYLIELWSLLCEKGGFLWDPRNSRKSAKKISTMIILEGSSRCQWELGMWGVLLFTSWSSLPLQRLWIQCDAAWCPATSRRCEEMWSTFAVLHPSLRLHCGTNSNSRKARCVRGSESLSGWNGAWESSQKFQTFLEIPRCSTRGRSWIELTKLGLHESWLVVWRSTWSRSTRTADWWARGAERMDVGMRLGWSTCCDACAFEGFSFVCLGRSSRLGCSMCWWTRFATHGPASFDDFWRQRWWTRIMRCSFPTWFCHFERGQAFGWRLSLWQRMSCMYYWCTLQRVQSLALKAWSFGVATWFRIWRSDWWTWTQCTVTQFRCS